MEQQQKGKALYVVLALAFAALIVGGATWFYMTGKDEVATSTDTKETAEAPATTQELQASVKTEVDGSLTELESELAAIELEEESEDDTVDF
jgi:uncharacterized protein HemX